MKSVDIHEAKAHLSRLLEEVVQDEEVTIAKAGRPIARLISITTSRFVRKPGFLRGRIRISEDFDAPLPDDVQRGFEGSDQ